MKLKLLLLLLSSFLLAPSAFPQGSLTPPGPPGPTMKALDQIASTGIPLDAKHVTASNANYEFVITKAGNYFLTGNLAVAKSNGIKVTVPDVTIDLNGFEISRKSGTQKGGRAIEIIGAAHRCTVKNGSITGVSDDLNAGGFLVGVVCSLDGVRGGSFRNLAVAGCSGAGLFGGGGWLIEHCTAQENGTGMLSFDGSVVSNCTANKNSLSGILLQTGVVTRCVASQNLRGITVSSGSSVINCEASSNTTDGIDVNGGNCLVLNNNCIGNGVGASVGAGILASGAGNRIESNNTVDNDTGFKVSSAGNLIIKNSSRGGSKAFDIAAGNSMGQEINVFNATTTTIINNSNPWANFLY